MPNLPPVSMPTTTNRQRRARPRSGYVSHRLRHLRGASGRGRRRRRSRRTRNCALGMAMSSRVGMRFSAREAKGPACDSSSARDAGVTSERCVSYARLSQALRALRGEGVLPFATAAILTRHSATAALTPRIRLRAPHPVPTTQYPANVGRSRAGSDSLPTLVTRARTRCTCLTLHRLLERSCCPKLGRFAARAFDVTPTRDDFTIPSALFLLLLRRLRLPLPLAPRRCSCRGQLDSLGDHRAACATSGVLPTRALPLEHAAARVCRKAGATVARNIRLARHECRCARRRCPAHRSCRERSPPLARVPTRPRCHYRLACRAAWRGPPSSDVQPACAVIAAARRKRHQTYLELARARRCRLVVLAVAAQRAFAASLLELPPAAELGEGQSPSCTNFSPRRAGTTPSRRCPPLAAPALQCRAPRHRDLRRDIACGQTSAVLNKKKKNNTDTGTKSKRLGGLGRRSASQDRFAAHWASWCDTLPVILARAPAAAARLRAALRRSPAFDGRGYPCPSTSM